MATYQQAQRQYDGQHDAAGEQWGRYSEAVSARVSELEKCPDAVERAINEVDCDHTDELTALRVKAFMTGRPADRHALETREKTLISAVLLRFAKHDIGDDAGGHRFRTSNTFADLLQGRRIGAQS